MNTKFKYNRTIVPYVLGIHSNLPKIHYFSFGEVLKPGLFDDISYKYDLFFDIKSKSYFNKIKKEKEFKYIYSDSIYYSSHRDKLEVLYWKKIGLTNISMHILMSDTSISLFVDKLYYSLFKLHVENVLPPGIHLRDIVYLKLVLDKYLPLHAAAFAADEKNGFLIMAPPNTGKSLTVTLLAKNSFKVLSEDLTVVNLNNFEIYSVPYTSTMYHETSKLKYLAPFSYYLPRNLKPFGELFKENIIPKAKLRKIFILEKGDDKIIEDADKNTCLIKILNLTRNEFSIRSNPVINSILYFLQKDIETLELEKILELISRIDVVILRAKKPTKYYNMLRKIL